MLTATITKHGSIGSQGHILCIVIKRHLVGERTLISLQISQSLSQIKGLSMHICFFHIIKTLKNFQIHSRITPELERQVLLSQREPLKSVDSAYGYWFVVKTIAVCGQLCTSHSNSGISCLQIH